jgi:MYXO-CTERM domain-containing protein
MAFANGHYTPAYLNDLGCCGCQSAPATTPAPSEFDFHSIPLWVWIAAGAGAFLLLSKKQR